MTECSYAICKHPARFRVQYTADYVDDDIRDVDALACSRHLAYFVRIGAEWMDPDPVCVLTA